MTNIREMASGLKFPEGPVALADGGVVLVELAGGKVTKVEADGTVRVLAEIRGGPNGSAIGPDGKLYVCNNGGCFDWIEADGLTIPLMVSESYVGGSIDRVDLSTGEVELLYSHAGDIKICAPNDIVFDDAGGFWFTDHGRVRARDRDRAGLFYASCDGSTIQETAFPMDCPNGIGLSPDQKTLYVSETFSGRIWQFELEAPGRIKPSGEAFPGHGGTLLYGTSDYTLLDSLAVDFAGNVCVASPSKGAIIVISPDGKLVEEVSLGAPLTTNICFGGPGMRTAFVTLGGPGKLVAIDWPRPGLELSFQEKTGSA
ncbi:gluconolactonase [Hoeflea marina]|uniref:Gluconolactonase n=1 Tax=Hoeflea marina TaxID=274592 RepID=A0A317PV22_9HYPH|nr:SMP-30/gluconolactonase/LRE family protein [Hoeflea marina]PWW04535.1 gluconolactonase [Hoeflea marina]